MSKKEVSEVRKRMMSHSERLAQGPIDYPKTLCSDYEVRDFEQIVENGRIVKKTVFKKVHPQDRNAGLTPMDFCLENIIAVGAEGSLRDCRLNGNTLGIADGVEGSIDSIIAAVDSAESNFNSENSEGE